MISARKLESLRSERLKLSNEQHLIFVDFITVRDKLEKVSCLIKNYRECVKSLKTRKASDQISLLKNKLDVDVEAVLQMPKTKLDYTHDPSVEHASSGTSNNCCGLLHCFANVIDVAQILTNCEMFPSTWEAIKHIEQLLLKFTKCKSVLSGSETHLLKLLDSNRLCVCEFKEPQSHNSKYCVLKHFEDGRGDDEDDDGGRGRGRGGGRGALCALSNLNEQMSAIRKRDNECQKKIQNLDCAMAFFTHTAKYYSECRPSEDGLSCSHSENHLRPSGGINRQAFITPGAWSTNYSSYVSLFKRIKK